MARGMGAKGKGAYEAGALGREKQHGRHGNGGDGATRGENQVNCVYMKGVDCPVHRGRIALPHNALISRTKDGTSPAMNTAATLV